MPVAPTMELLLGVDDTDAVGHSPGTGRLARNLGAHYEQWKMATLGGVVRHQLLVDPRIPYTSHNSPACLILRLDETTGASPRDLFDEAAHYITGHSARGSDPGICTAERSEVGPAVIEFGHRAGSVVLMKREAIELAAAQQLFLAEPGVRATG